MRYDLSSGAWLEMKAPGDLTAGDKLAMHQATALPMGSGSMEDLAEGRASFNFSLGTIDEQLYGVLAGIIQGWSYPYCLPSQDDSADQSGKRTYAESLRRLPLDDWNEIEEITEPHMAKLRANPKGAKTTSTNSGRSSRGKAVNSRPV